MQTAVLAAILSAAPAAPAKPAQAPVTAAEVEAFVAGADRRDARVLRTLFGERIMASTTVFDHKLATAEAFLKAIEPCRRHRTQRYGSDPDIFVQWLCPGRPGAAPANVQPGFVAKLWHHQLGLALSFARDEVVTGPVPAPASVR